MTHRDDDRRTGGERRESDRVDHLTLALRMDAIEVAVESHIHPEVSKIVDYLEGPPVEHFDGTLGPERNLDAGMDRRVQRIEAGQTEILKELANGIKYRVAGKDLAKIVSAVAASIAGIVVALAQAGVFENHP